MSPDQESSRHSRFVGRFVVVPFALALLLALSTAAPASASVGWCKSDPVVVVNLTLADVFTSAQFSDLDKVTGATQIVVVVPSGVIVVLATPGPGFGYGEFVTFQTSPDLKATLLHVDVVVKVFVPSTDNAMPIRVYFAPRILGLLWPMSTEGNANSWITLSSSM